MSNLSRAETQYRCEVPVTKEYLFTGYDVTIYRTGGVLTHHSKRPLHLCMEISHKFHYMTTVYHWLMTLVLWRRNNFACFSSSVVMSKFEARRNFTKQRIMDNSPLPEMRTLKYYHYTVIDIKKKSAPVEYLATNWNIMHVDIVNRPWCR